jgi:hypothetical protein
MASKMDLLDEEIKTIRRKEASIPPWGEGRADSWNARTPGDHIAFRSPAC